MPTALDRVQAFADAYFDTDFIAKAGEHELLHSDLVDALAGARKELAELRAKLAGAETEWAVRVIDTWRTGQSEIVTKPNEASARRGASDLNSRSGTSGTVMRRDVTKWRADEGEK